ncbi:MAG: glucose-6-phosphate isomerase [Nitrospiraceae bacterium]|nr:glucose-6-phosphate isomerase [Nitrospiraceae bacterium]
MLQLDFTNMMHDVISENGLSKKQIDNIISKVRDVDKKIKTRGLPGLGFIDLVEQDTLEIKKTGSLIKKDFENFIILGIGGSALGPKAILEALSPFHNLDKKPKIFIYDNVDPRTMDRILSIIDIGKTSVNVITKSGSTAETMASFMILWDRLKGSSEKFIATTDPEKGNLRKIANEKGFKTFAIPHNVGGRFSVLSPVGLLLAEVMGIDSNEFLRGAKDISQRCKNEDIWKNPAYLFGTLLYLMKTEKKRFINVMVPYADGLKPMAEWFCQLWAESLGKNGIGFTPYPSLGTTDQHSQLQLWMEGPEDKVIIFISVEDYFSNIEIPKVFNEIEGIRYLGGHKLSELIKTEQNATALALAGTKKPNMTITIPQINAYYLGQLFHFFEIATVFTGILCDVNPFDQPGVEEGKNFTYGMMGRKGYEAKKQEADKSKKSRYTV